MSTEQTQSSFTDASPAPEPAAGRADPGLLFWLHPLSSAALGGLTVGGFFFVIAAAVFLSNRAGYGAALSVYGTVITLLPVSIVWAVLRWTRARLGPDSTDMTGIPTSWDRHWVGVTWWTAAMATGWIVIAVLAAGLPDLPAAGRQRLSHLLRATARRARRPGRNPVCGHCRNRRTGRPRPGQRRSRPAGTHTRPRPSGLYAVFRGGDTAHRGRGRQDRRQPGPCAANQLTARGIAPRPGAASPTGSPLRLRHHQLAAAFGVLLDSHQVTLEPVAPAPVVLVDQAGHLHRRAHGVDDAQYGQERRVRMPQQHVGAAARHLGVNRTVPAVALLFQAPVHLLQDRKVPVPGGRQPQPFPGDQFPFVGRVSVVAVAAFHPRFFREDGPGSAA